VGNKKRKSSKSSRAVEMWKSTTIVIESPTSHEDAPTGHEDVDGNDCESLMSSSSELGE